jgi:hypothetical protein
VLTPTVLAQTHIIRQIKSGCGAAGFFVGKMPAATESPEHFRDFNFGGGNGRFDRVARRRRSIGPAAKCRFIAHSQN